MAGLILYFDTETGGFPTNAPLDDPSQPPLVQLGARLKEGNIVRGEINFIIKPEGWTIAEGAAKVHGITTEIATKFGVPLKLAAFAFESLVKKADLLVAHNFSFDDKIMQIVFARLKMKSVFTTKPHFCTMLATTNICQIPNKARGGYKWPRLEEAYAHFFNKSLDGAHDAAVDLTACAEVYEHLLKNDLVNATN